MNYKLLENLISGRPEIKTKIFDSKSSRRLDFNHVQTTLGWVHISEAMRMTDAATPIPINPPTVKPVIVPTTPPHPAATKPDVVHSITPPAPHTKPVEMQLVWYGAYNAFYVASIKNSAHFTPGQYLSKEAAAQCCAFPDWTVTMADNQFWSTLFGMATSKIGGLIP